MNISKEEFGRYVKVQKSGRVNMFDVKNVEILSCLSKDKIIYIMDNYEELSNEFGD